MSKISSIIIAMVGLCVPGLCVAQDRPYTAKDYAECLSNAATKLELSGEAATEVAIAVLRVCRAAGPRKTETNVMSKLTEQDGKQALELVRKDLHEEVVRFVVEIRACRKERDCATSSIRTIPVSPMVTYLLSPTS